MVDFRGILLRVDEKDAEFPIIRKGDENHLNCSKDTFVICVIVPANMLTSTPQFPLSVADGNTLNTRSQHVL